MKKRRFLSQCVGCMLASILVFGSFGTSISQLAVVAQEVGIDVTVKNTAVPGGIDSKKNFVSACRSAVNNQATLPGNRTICPTSIPVTPTCIVVPSCPIATLPLIVMDDQYFYNRYYAKLVECGLEEYVNLENGFRFNLRKAIADGRIPSFEQYSSCCMSLKFDSELALSDGVENCIVELLVMIVDDIDYVCMIRAANGRLYDDDGACCPWLDGNDAAQSRLENDSHTYVENDLLAPGAIVECVDCNSGFSEQYGRRVWYDMWSVIYVDRSSTDPDSPEKSYAYVLRPYVSVKDGLFVFDAIAASGAGIPDDLIYLQQRQLDLLNEGVGIGYYTIGKDLELILCDCCGTDVDTGDSDEMRPQEIVDCLMRYYVKIQDGYCVFNREAAIDDGYCCSYFDVVQVRVNRYNQLIKLGEIVIDDQGKLKDVCDSTFSKYMVVKNGRYYFDAKRARADGVPEYFIEYQLDYLEGINEVYGGQIRDDLTVDFSHSYNIQEPYRIYGYSWENLEYSLAKYIGVKNGHYYFKVRAAKRDGINRDLIDIQLENLSILNAEIDAGEATLEEDLSLSYFVEYSCDIWRIHWFSHLNYVV